MAIVRIERDGRQFTVYVAGSADDVWAFYDGRIYRHREVDDAPAAPHRPVKAGRYVLTSPMPATVVKIAVAPGQAVHHGDTLVVVEAMKMELPIRAPADATVKTINCREGEMVQPDRELVELE